MLRVSTKGTENTTLSLSSLSTDGAVRHGRCLLQHGSTLGRNWPSQPTLQDANAIAVLLFVICLYELGLVVLCSLFAAG